MWVFIFYIMCKVPMFVALFLAITDPNTHILWIENTEARVKALGEIEEGSFSSSSACLNLCPFSEC